MFTFWPVGFPGELDCRGASARDPYLGKGCRSAGDGCHRHCLCTKWHDPDTKGAPACPEDEVPPSAGGRLYHGTHPDGDSGSFRENYNNHPFPGKTEQLQFALAHNGVLYNDFELKHTHQLPKTIIETDSYVAVQLIEQQGELSAKSLKQMAEALDGSFTITVLDSEDNLYFIKGNNPLTIYLLPGLGCYVYASTKEILEVALKEAGLSDASKVSVTIAQGDILRIDQAGNRLMSHFDASKLSLWNYYGGFGRWYNPYAFPHEDDYLEEVVRYGLNRGVPEAEMRLLISAGYNALDLEELLYDPVLRENCVREIVCDCGIC